MQITILVRLSTTDPDGDRYTNLQEITAGTYPGDATSHPSAADTTPPVVDGFAIPATATSLTVAITTFTATDARGVTGYLLTRNEHASCSSAQAGSLRSRQATRSHQPVQRRSTPGQRMRQGISRFRLSAATTITLPDTIAPRRRPGSRIPATATSLTVAISTFTATDDAGRDRVLWLHETGYDSQSATGWSRHHAGKLHLRHQPVQRRSTPGQRMRQGMSLFP